ncbi:MAG: fatty acid desaturase [Acidimicrobiia bacterium]|nr:fatty acid desaturase [Acidimicrobiia bacterium]
MPTRYQTSVERSHGAEIIEVVGAEEIERLAVPNGADTALHLVVVWVEIALLLVAAGAIGALPFPLTVLCAVVLIVLMGTRINALNVVMHEASHGFLCRDRARNDRVCNATASWWMLHSVEEYRPTHRLHHRYLNGPEDPDLPSYLVPGRRGALARLLALDLLGVTALRRALSLVSNASSDEAGSARLSGATVLRNTVGKVAAQAVLITVFVIARGVVVGLAGYVLFWLVPALSVFPALLRLKTVTEHFDARLRDPGAPVWIARTSRARWLQDHLVGARMEYHFEHHALPTIPYPGLRTVHRRLVEAGRFDPPAPTDTDSGGYVRYIRTLQV